MKLLIRGIILIALSTITVGCLQPVCCSMPREENAPVLTLPEPHKDNY